MRKTALLSIYRTVKYDKEVRNMILSMTGFGRGEQVLHGRDITVEIRSVNSRYFEYSSRIPRSFS